MQKTSGTSIAAPTSEVTAGGFGRFVLLESIGHGGMGNVFRAFDPVLGCDVALKTLNSVSPTKLRAVKQEFRTLTDFDHPNILHLYELFVEAEQCYYSMELLPSPVNFLMWCRNEQTTWAITHPTLAEYAGRADIPAPAASPAEPTGPLDVTRVARALLQLAEALDAMHGAGLLHCDIKPGNVLLTPDGVLHLVDFGLVMRMALGYSAADQGHFMGTPPYVAPERTRQGKLSAAADWYSVGMMLSELLAATETPPDGLSDLTVSLLAPEPARRGGTRDVRAWAARWVPGTSVEHVAPLVPPGRRTLCVGRLREWRTLERTLGRVTIGESTVVRVTGPSGVGKTTLLESWLSTLRQPSEVLVLAGRSHPMATVAFRTVDEIVDGISRLHRETSDEFGLGPDERVALRRLFPILSRLLTEPREAPTPPSVAELREKSVAGLTRILTSLAEDRPVVVWLDDVQWGDVDSARLLASMWTGPPIRGVLWVLSHPDGAHAQSSALRILNEAIEAGRLPCVDLPIGPLGDDDARIMLQALSVPSGTAAETILAEAGGVPILLTMGASTLASDTDPRPLDARLAARIADLPPLERELLELISVAGYPLSVSLVGDAVGRVDGWRLAIDHLRRAKWVRFHAGVRDPDLILSHAKIGEAVCARLSQTATQRLHQVLASATLQRKDRAMQALIHLEAAGASEQAASLAVRAAREAESALAFERAAELWARASALGAREEPNWRLVAHRADMLAAARRSREAGEAYAQAAEELAARWGDAVQVGRLREKAFSHLMRTGDFIRGREIMRTCLLGAGLPVAEGRVACIAGILYYETRNRLTTASSRVRPSEATHGLARLQLEIAWSAAMSVAFVNSLQGAYYTQLHATLALQTGEPTHLVRALERNAMLLATMGGERRLQRAAAQLALADTFAQPVQTPTERAWRAMTRGGMAFERLDWPDALVSHAEAATVFRNDCQGASWEAGMAQFLMTACYVSLGQYDALRSLASEMARDAERLGDAWVPVALAIGPPSWLGLIDDDPERVARQADAAIATWPREAADALRLMHVHCAITVDLYHGNCHMALDVYDDALPDLRRAGFLTLPQHGSDLRFAHARALIGRLQRLPAGAEAQRLRASLEQVHGALLKVALGGVRARAQVIHASLLALRGEYQCAADEMADAADRLEATFTPAHAEAARMIVQHWRGEVVDDRPLLRRGVKAPRRFAAALLGWTVP